jgi:hypothetical protein
MYSPNEQNRKPGRAKINKVKRGKDPYCDVTPNVRLNKCHGSSKFICKWNKAPLKFKLEYSVRIYHADM